MCIQSITCTGHLHFQNTKIFLATVPLAGRLTELGQHHPVWRVTLAVILLGPNPGRVIRAIQFWRYFLSYHIANLTPPTFPSQHHFASKRRTEDPYVIVGTSSIVNLVTYLSEAVGNARPSLHLGYDARGLTCGVLRACYLAQLCLPTVSSGINAEENSFDIKMNRMLIDTHEKFQLIPICLSCTVNKKIETSPR